MYVMRYLLIISIILIVVFASSFIGAVMLIFDTILNDYENAVATIVVSTLFAISVLLNIFYIVKTMFGVHHNWSMIRELKKEDLQVELENRILEEKIENVELKMKMTND